jgi:hypothetical protein
MIRDLSATFGAGPYIPFPPAREWISYISAQEPLGIIPDVVTEHVVLNINCPPAPRWGRMIPSGPLNVTIAFNCQLWLVEHDGECQILTSEGCLCQECTPCENGSCWACEENSADAVGLLTELTLLIVSRVRFHNSLYGTNISITLVGFNEYTDAFFPDTTAAEMQDNLINMVVDMAGEEYISYQDVALCLSFPTREAYLEEVGVEVYNLRHAYPHYWEEGIRMDKLW